MKKLDAFIGDGPHHPSSLRAFLAALPERQALTVDRDGAEDFVATALVLEMERQGRDEVVAFTGGDVPVVTNIFGSRERICAIAGAHDQPSFSDRWMGALAAGKTMQGIGHVGRGLEDFVGKHFDRQTAGSAAALAGTAAVGAGVMGAYKDSQQPYPQAGYYPAPF